LLDLHGSIGPEKNWASQREYERLAGVELVQNRIEMTAQLGGKVIVMHVPNESKNLAGAKKALGRKWWKVSLAIAVVLVMGAAAGTIWYT
jgi:sugar phosphate isomerase/epimerase